MRLPLLTALLLTAPAIFAQNALDLAGELNAMSGAVAAHDSRAALQHAFVIQSSAFAQAWPQGSPKYHAKDVARPALTAVALADQILRASNSGDIFRLKIYAEALPVIVNGELNFAPDTTDLSSEVSTQLSRMSALPAFAEEAFKTKAAPVASGYAAELLRIASAYPSYYKGEAIFYSNLIAGRVALESGDVQSAASFLLAGGKSEGSPVLNTFGPNMMLAAELFEGGQKDAVLAFLNECKHFWNSSLLDYWIADIQQGKTPNFHFLHS